MSKFFGHLILQNGSIDLDFRSPNGTRSKRCDVIKKAETFGHFRRDI